MAIQRIQEEIEKKILEFSLLDRISRAERIQLTGLSGSLETLFLVTAYRRLNRPVLAIYPDPDEAESMRDEFSAFLDSERIAFFPGMHAGDRHVQLHIRRYGEQMEVVRDLIEGRLGITTVSSQGLIRPLPKPKDIIRDRIRISVGANFNLPALLSRMVDYGYSREAMVEKPGEVSLRGGILDIFPLTGENPQRIEFFGDQIESIRAFDVVTQRSVRNTKGFDIVSSPNLWTGCSETILSYFPEDSLIFIKDPDLVYSEAKKEIEKFPEGILPLDLFASQVKLTVLEYHTLHHPSGAFDFAGRAVQWTGAANRNIRESLHHLSQSSEFIDIYCESSQQAKRISDFLDVEALPIPGLWIGEGPIRRGFILPATGTTVLADRDLFRKPKHKKHKDRFKEGTPIREISSLKRGDFVVHIDYGIGRYQGLETITVNGMERECLSLLYEDGDRLYVQVDKMEKVHKYSGQEGSQPSLSKLGTHKWDQIKEKTKKSIQAIAKDLIALYSARQHLPGHAFPSDTVWEKELEARFPFDETPDQAAAIEEVKQDMMKPSPMDRLVCGDVGFGKTEVAVRAAFKSVCDGKQVAVLVPTTLLAEQHLNTFRERLEPFPVTIEMLSRFRSRAEQGQIVEKLKNGKVDVVIGTHRLLSADVGFRNLGLLVIDEEQRFGVRHKEKLKSLRRTVDVLALSATPIPRTLHLSMMGIRDMSLINTPPKDRFPIHTEVMAFNEEVIREAIRRELDRHGQIFFVHNRIQSIHAVSEMLKKIIPGMRIGVAHGQMPEHELESVMLAFIRGEFECLVATMIIESGLDLPHVNTLLVNRADRMGLAQLYQLRGRVGRSHHRAYAYLFTPPLDRLNMETIKRLRTIEEFTELGSGFQIAMRDLEIRGAGNLLGVEQSGYMNAVGFDLYTRLVREAVEELKEQEPVREREAVKDTECSVEITGDAFLPGIYVEDENTRVDLYSRLSAMTRTEDIDRFAEELADRFGPAPNAAERLLEAARLKIIGQKLGMMRLKVGRQKLYALLDESRVKNQDETEHLADRIRSIIDATGGAVRFIQHKGFGFVVNLPEENSLEFAKKILQSWK